MKAIKINARTDEFGIAEIKVCTDTKNSDVNLIVVVENGHEEGKPEKGRNRFDFSDLAGRIKWDMDPVEYQRRIREEW
ncbi:MAG: hypothetical protein QM472_01430 [Spirochaetota bacterium]|nr:hypothetical protein [Spirochaetota bacterium]